MAVQTKRSQITTSSFWAGNPRGNIEQRTFVWLMYYFYTLSPSDVQYKFFAPVIPFWVIIKDFQNNSYEDHRNGEADAQVM